MTCAQPGEAHLPTFDAIGQNPHLSTFKPNSRLTGWGGIAGLASARLRRLTRQREGRAALMVFCFGKKS